MGLIGLATVNVLDLLVFAGLPRRDALVIELAASAVVLGPWALHQP